MLGILRDRLLRLGRDDDGVALVVTLAVFFFLYLVCAGVFAVGNAVKERIHLQNAVDAAAYSAAVVQADTISRIATINRAMAWTYVQMTKRQMDYVVYKWLKHTVKHYEDDLRAAISQGFEGEHKEHGHIYYSIGDGEDVFLAPCGDQNRVVLNGHYDKPELVKRKDWFNRDGIADYASSFLLKNLSGESFYAANLPAVGTVERLKRQLDEDMRNIRSMNAALTYLTDGSGSSDGMANHIEDAVLAILRANVPGYMRNQCKYMVKASSNPRLDYMRHMRAAEEDQFVSWMDDENEQRTHRGLYVDADSLFGTGCQTWFNHIAPEKDGIQRGYMQKDKLLCSEWKWCAWSWTCDHTYIGKCVRRKVDTVCRHECDADNHRYGSCDKCSGRLKDHRARLNAIHLRDKYFNAEASTLARAKPLMLTRDYFGPKGTITVGLMLHDGNPWGGVLGQISGGLYSAFNPFNDTWCFASAKAGYKLYDLSEDVGQAYDGELDGLGWENRHNGAARAFKGDRDYCIDWKRMRWMRSNSVRMREPYWVVVDHLTGKREKRWRYHWVEMPTEIPTPSIRRLLALGWEFVLDRNGKRLKRKLDKTFWRQSWNLTQSDWDAVMIPVRQGGSEAIEVKTHSHREWMEAWNGKRELYSYEPVWTGRAESYIDDLVREEYWKNLDGRVAMGDGRFGVVYAGGTHDPDPTEAWGRNLIRTTAGWNGWQDIPGTAANHSGDSKRINARWSIEKQGAKLDWARLSNMMYH